MSSDESDSTPESIKLDAIGISFDNLLPEKSKDKYLKAYNDFEKWKNAKGAKSVSEALLIVYFQHLSSTMKSSSLWVVFSMLRSTISIKHDLQINTYTKLLAFLRRKSDGHVTKKSKVFTKQNVETFLNEAPDHWFLAIKVAFIFGVHGACRGNELVNIKVNDVEKRSDSLLVNVLDLKTKRVRSFTVREEYAKIVEKYQALRPSKTKTDRFFIGYTNGKCTGQAIGKNKMNTMPKLIAKYLQLENPELYTGHCYRKTSASLLEASGPDMAQIKRRGGRKSDAVAEVSEQDAQPGPSKALGTRTSLDSKACRDQDPLSTAVQQCRFCGEFNKDCVAVSDSMPYLAANKMTLALNDTSVQLDFNIQSLPNTVCRDCDAKLQEFADFLKVVKAAQDTLINVAEERKVGETTIELEVVKKEVEAETETILIKTEYASENEESDDEKEDKVGIVDCLTLGETVFVKKSVSHKRKSDTVTANPKKLKAKKCDSELIIDIKEEIIEEEDGQGQSGVSDSDVKPSKLELATSALVFEMAGKGTSEYQGYRSDR